MPVPDDAMLDNPAWHALGASPSTVGDPANGPLARRYRGDVAPFAAIPDEPDDDAWDALRDLVGPGNGALLFRRSLSVPEHWEHVGSIPCLQMVPGGPFEAPPAHLTRLGPDDVDDMLDLVALAAPGPFERHTIDLGCYFGVREGGRLVAMGGERMRPPGWSELSAICTHPEARRRGLAAAIMAHLMQLMDQRPNRAFLHVALENVGGIRAYERLGFTVRCEPEVAILVAPQ